jgi:SAM-dependent methyltransferase
MVTCAICGATAAFMAKHPEADLYRCPACTHCFTDLASVEPAPYDSEYFADHHRRWFANPNVKLFASIAKTIPRGASVLDVGCGRGHFLRYLREHRADLRLSGIDLSLNEPSDGIRYYRGDFLTMPFDERFDAVVSLAVIEHVADIRGFVTRLQELARPNGTVTVMTLNESSLLYGLARTGRHVGVPLAFDRLYSRHHLHHFTRSSLRKLLGGRGFQVVAEHTHNAPLAAIDIPVSSALADALLRSFMWMICKAGDATGRAYLQTITCRRQAAGHTA